MTDLRPDLRPTSEVFNQVETWRDVNLATCDAALHDAVRRYNAPVSPAALEELGATLGSHRSMSHADAANVHVPVLHAFDGQGRRQDIVEYHPGYHALLSDALEQDVHHSPWRAGAAAGEHVARAARMYLRHQVEQGTSCPITMTFAAVPSIRLNQTLASEWVPRIAQQSYDAGVASADAKTSCLIGMAMTERQGGSDVRANTTRALPSGEDDSAYVLDGHKWFCSAPMSDGFLTLAQAAGGLSCFLVPQFRPDGTRNGLQFDRLKDKLGNRSNASAELRFVAAYGARIGEEGRGVASILEMVRHTRLDCAIGGSALIRRCVSEALNHCEQRSVFGKRLSVQKLMRNVLTDLCLEAEAATALSLRLAHSFATNGDSAQEAALCRLLTPVSKFWVTRRESVVAREAMECLGGNGFVETSPLPRLYRESPLNSIWEGAGNVQCLDVMRALHRDATVRDAFAAFTEGALGAYGSFDAARDRVLAWMRPDGFSETEARQVVELCALVSQAALLQTGESSEVADAFIRSRLGAEGGRSLGTLPVAVDHLGILGRSISL
ncbi:MAG: putative acyl-CoA dehydrogenase [Bradymonadia bacterium]|jgi:putative acyl-CoA dehydrogenase